jgi:hypothetical protein
MTPEATEATGRWSSRLAPPLARKRGPAHLGQRLGRGLGKYTDSLADGNARCCRDHSSIATGLRRFHGNVAPAKAEVDQFQARSTVVDVGADQAISNPRSRVWSPSADL